MKTKKPLLIVLETGSISGGVRVVGELANRVVARGRPVKIFSPNLRESMRWFRLSNDVEWITSFQTGTVADYDTLMNMLAAADGWKMATYWRTAASMISAEAFEPGEGLYLVQDIETVYASEAALQPVVVETYTGLRNITTSKWVMSQLPEADYIGIGLSRLAFAQEARSSKRNGRALASLRIQALKGFDRLMEAHRHLAKHGIVLSTFGMDHPQALACFRPVEHVQSPSDSQVMGFMKTHSVFLNTSRHEGFGLPRLEAMANGCPVVTFDDGGSQDYCVDGENCLIVGTALEMADAAARIVSDPKLAAKLREGGLKTAEAWQWGPVIDRLEAILDAA
jgi:glycosyltransferase involved in cell wall biosynthesis